MKKSIAIAIMMALANIGFSQKYIQQPTAINTWDYLAEYGAELPFNKNITLQYDEKGNLSHYYHIINYPTPYTQHYWFTHDALNRLTFKQSYYEGGSWWANYRYYYTYDVSSNLTECLAMRLDRDDMYFTEEFIIDSKDVYQYDNGKKIRWEHYNNSTLVLQNYYLYEYSDDNTWSSETKYNANNQPITKTEYTYSDTQEILTKTVTNWSTLTLTWNNESLTEYEYGDSHLIEKRITNWTDGEISQQQRQLYEYNENGNCTRILFQTKVDGVYADQNRATYLYDEDNLCTNANAERWNDTTWVLGGFPTGTYLFFDDIYDDVNDAMGSIAFCTRAEVSGYITTPKPLNIVAVDTVAECNSYEWHGQLYTESGTYTFSYNNSSGESCVEVLLLTIDYGTHNVETVVRGESYDWHGQTYTQSGTYTFSYLNDIGCPSVDTLHLTIRGTNFDFSIINPTGYELYYRIIDAQNQWVEITYPCQHDDNYWWGYDKPEGKLILADTITYNGTDYTLVAIGDHAFDGCSDLRGALELPSTILSIGAGAFKGCSKLNGNLNIPAFVTRIEDEAFCDCSGFADKLYLTDSLTYIGAKAFQYCAFKGMLALPGTLTVIGDEAFKGCTHFNSISIKAVVPPTTSPNAFDGVPTWISVAVPYKAKEPYQNTPGWMRFADHVVEKSYWSGGAEPWTQGSGVADDPYLIESAEQLAWLAKSVNERKIGKSLYQNDVNVYQDTCFKLVVDINLKKYEHIQWIPIGVLNSFSGHFDGDGHTISNVYIVKSRYEKNAVGLFGVIRNASIQNTIVDDWCANLNYYDKVTGGLVGLAFNSYIYNCHTKGMIKKSKICGGIVGQAQKCRIDGCNVQIDFDASDIAGGVVGALVCDSISAPHEGVFNCGYVGDISNAYLAGGVVGECQTVLDGKGSAHVEKCFSRGCITKEYQANTSGLIMVNNTDNHLGGVVGNVADIDTLFILNCYSNDTITSIPAEYGNAKYYAGGIVAYANENATLYIKNCYHVGPLTARIKGGIITRRTNMTIIRNCFFDRAVAPDDGFGLPMSSDEMKTEAFVNRLNNGSTVFKQDAEPYENGGYPVFGTDGLIFVGAEWYYEIMNDDGSLTYQHLQCTGDTTIGNEKPKIIVRTNQIYDKSRRTETTHEYVFERNGVVYWWNKALQSFTVLYDFGAEVGDEWVIKVGDESFVTRVYEVENQMIDGIPYKKMTIGDANDVFSGMLISAIGHLTSFFPEKLMNRSKNYRLEGLRCYWLDGDLMLKLGTMDCDEVYEKYHHHVDETDVAGFQIYPNPTDGLLHVVGLSHCGSPTGQPEYRLTNLMGQTLMAGRVSESLRIDLSSLPSGIYFITVDNVTKKITKQ